MPRKYANNHTVVLCGLKSTATEEGLQKFLKSQKIKTNIENISRMLVDRTNDARRFVYLNVGSDADAHDLIKALNDIEAKDIGSPENQCFLQAVLKNQHSKVSWAKYMPKTKTCEGQVIEKLRTQCIVRSKENIKVDKDCFHGEWAQLKIGDTLQMEIRLNQACNEWQAVEAIKVQEQIAADSPTDSPKQGKAAEVLSGDTLSMKSVRAATTPDQITEKSKVCADPEGRARSYRIQRLLLELVPKVLLHVFEQEWKRWKGKPWTAACGRDLRGMLVEKDEIKSLGKKGLQKIESGNLHSWDITILAKILLDNPGLLRKTPPSAKAVQALRTQRNEFVHDLSSANTLSAGAFQAKWRELTDELGALVSTIGPEEQAQYRAECEKIQTEALDEDKAKQLSSELGDLRESLSEVREDVEALRAKVGNLATQSQMGRVIKSEVAAAALAQQNLNDTAKTVTMTNGRRFVLTSKVLGQGAMGSVYVGRDSDDQHLLVAIKTCNIGTAAERGAREAQNMERIQHDNVVRFLGYCEDPGRGALTIAMDLVVGVTYEVHLAGHGPLAWRVASKDVMQIAAGMAEVHSHGIAHRDLKPANIMRKNCGHLVIVDFGLSKALGVNTTVTTTGQAVGSPVYMSPEALQGASERINCSSDVFSIGVIFYEALTTCRPWSCGDEKGDSGSSSGSSSGRRLSGSGAQGKSMTPLQLSTYIGAVVQKPPLPMANRTPAGFGTIPSAIENLICCRALAKSQSDRFADAGAMLSALEDTVDAINSTQEEAAAAGTGPGTGQLSDSAATFWVAVSNGEESAPWEVFESQLEQRFPALSKSALVAIRDTVDENQEGCVGAAQFRTFAGTAPLENAVAPFIDRARASVARLKRIAGIAVGSNSSTASAVATASATTAVQPAEPAGVFYTASKIAQICYISAGMLYGSSRKPGTLVLRGGVLSMSKSSTGKERDRFNLLGADLSVAPSGRDSAAMEVSSVTGSKREVVATYVFASAGVCAEWVEAVRGTKKWLMSGD